MSIQKSWSELQVMARACRIVVDTLDLLEAAAQPGVTTRELDRIAHDAIVRAGAPSRTMRAADGKASIVQYSANGSSLATAASGGATASTGSDFPLR